MKIIMSAAKLHVAAVHMAARFPKDVFLDTAIIAALHRFIHVPMHQDMSTGFIVQFAASAAFLSVDAVLKAKIWCQLVYL